MAVIFAVPQLLVWRSSVEQMKRRRSLSTNRQSFLHSSLWKNYRTSTQGTKIKPTLKSQLPIGADQKWQQEPKVTWPSAVLWWDHRSEDDDICVFRVKVGNSGWFVLKEKSLSGSLEKCDSTYIFADSKKTQLCIQFTAFSSWNEHWRQ